MFSILRSAVILLALAATACAELQVSVQGPTEPVPVGRLVKLTPEGPDGTDFGWGMPVGEFEVAEQSGKPVLFFSAEQPGRVLFVLQAVAAPPLDASGERPEKTLVFFWLDVVGADGRTAPTPGPTPVLTITERSKRAFSSPDGTFSDQARSDAKALQIALTAVADLLEDGRQYADPDQLFIGIETALKANGWTSGRYSAMNTLFGEILGKKTEVKTFTDAQRAAYVANLRAIAAGAKLAAESAPKGVK